MKNLKVFILIFCLGAGQLFAQKAEKLQLKEGSKLLDAVNVNNGVILLTGNEYIFRSNHDCKITYYWPDLTQRYQVEFDKANLTTVMTGHFVASPTGNNVYYVNRPGGFMGGSNTENIFYIDSSGTKTSFKVKKDVKNGHINVIFADDNYLYFVTKEKNPDRHNRKFPKLQFVRVDHEKAVSKVWLDLPDPENDATEWSYLGHTLEVSYFVSKSFDEQNKATYRIGVVDGDGKLLDDFKMSFTIKDGQIMPEYNHSSASGTAVIDNHNIKVTTHTYTNSSGGTTTSVTYSPYPEAFGDIMVDPITNGFYVYGLSGPKYVKARGLFAKRTVPVVNTFYVYKYDQDGKELWNYNGKLSGASDYFKSKATFMTRDVKLNLGLNNSVKFQAFTKNEVYTFDFNAETGKLNQNYNNTFKNNATAIDLGSCKRSGDKSDMAKFMNKGDKGDYSQLNFRTLNNNIVVRNFYKDNRIDLYKFVDE